MDSPPPAKPSPAAPFRQALTLALAEAAESPFITHGRTTRPWLRLIGVIVLAAVLIFVLIGALGGLLGLISLAAPSFDFQSGLLDPVPESPRRLFGESGFLLILALSLLALAVAVLGAAMIVHRRPLADFLWPARRPDVRQLATGFAIMAVVCLAFWPIGWLVEGVIDPAPVLNPAYLPDSRWTYALTASAMLLVAAAAEEIAFRGVLLKILGGFTRRVWLLVLINGVLFSLIHLDPDPAAFVARALSGAVWTWAALRLGGIEFAVGAHWANNLVIALLGAPMSEAASVDQAISVIYLIPEAVIAVVVLAATEWMVRRRRAPDQS